jgi:phage I-like protein
MTGPNAIATFAVALNADGGPPARIAALPAGKIVGRDGRGWINDAPDAVVAAFKTGGIDLPIDIEHATELKGPKGEPAPAQGWITGLHNVDGAIHADIAWTEEGARLVSSRAYRYLSPAFMHERAGGRRITKFLSAGLTNKPNLDIPALNAAAKDQDMDMDRASVCAALGLVAAAADADIMTAINRLKTPDPQKFVPKADLEAALNRATTAEQKLADRDKAERETKIAVLVDAAVKDGKIAPASKEHYLALCREADGLERVTALLASLPTLTGASGLDKKKPNQDASADADGLCESNRAVCRQMGLDPKAYAAQLKAHNEETAR